MSSLHLPRLTFFILLIATRAWAGTAPVAPRIAHPVTVHGHTRADDYFWLRDRARPEVMAYLKAENAYAKEQLESTETLQETLFQEMASRLDKTDASVPYRKGGYLYYQRWEEGKQYPIHCRKKEEGGPEQIVLDVNGQASGKKLFRLGDFQVSDDGRLLAYSVDLKGDLNWELHVKDIATGREFPDHRSHLASLSWAADNHTLFYTTKDEAGRPYRLYRHELGETVADPLLFEEKDEKFRLLVARSRGAAFVLVSSTSKDTADCRYLKASDPQGSFSLIIPRRRGLKYSVEQGGDFFYIHTNDRGADYRLVAVPTNDPRPEKWRELLPHRAGVKLSDPLPFRDFVVMMEWEKGLPQVRILNLRSKATAQLTFPDPIYHVSLDSDGSDYASNTLRYNYETFLTPSHLYSYRLDTGKRDLLKAQKCPGLDPERYQMERRYAVAKDGARIPISLVYLKGMRHDGGSPLLLEAYGAYGSSRLVEFESTRFSLLDRGVVFALAHVRGGSELGMEWYLQGRRLNKKNTFTDFIAVAEQLVSDGYTNPQRLGIQGLSAGGLLMGAVANLRPDLFRAVLLNVPFVDALNSMLDPTIPLTTEEYEEWGDPRRKEEYEYMASYSPYDNLERKAYPAMLARASWNDRQVVYWEPAKYVAKLRTLRTDENFFALITNFDAGHAGPSGRFERLRQRAQDDAFFLTELGVR